jgi:hypothetical protein
MGSGCADVKERYKGADVKQRCECAEDKCAAIRVKER